MKRHRLSPETGTGDRIRYRGIPVWPDRRFSRLFERLAKLVGAVCETLPFFATVFVYPIYSVWTALDLRKRKCDVIHVMNYSNFLPVIHTLNPRALLVLHMHCEWLTQLESAVIRKRLERADLVIGCSRYVTHKIGMMFPEAAAGCGTVWNGVDHGIFTPAEMIPDAERPTRSVSSGRGPVSGHTETAGPAAVAEKPTGRILFMARISPEKGLHILLAAFARVRSRYPEARLEVVGTYKVLPEDFNMRFARDSVTSSLSVFYRNGTPAIPGRDPTERYRIYLEGSIREEDRSAVVFLGSVPHTALPVIYRRADVFVFPSVWDEPFGMPVIEAMACGVPVVASRSGVIPEILEDGRCGVLVERNDPDALADGILEVLDSPGLRNRLSQSGRRRVERFFTWEKTAGTLCSLYEEGLRNGRRTGAVRDRQVLLRDSR